MNNWITILHFSTLTCSPPFEVPHAIEPIRFLPLKFRGMQIPVYAIVPDSPPPLGKESVAETTTHLDLVLVQRFSGCLTEIRSRNWRMRVRMAYWNQLYTWSPSQNSVCSSLDRCHAYLRAGHIHVYKWWGDILRTLSSVRMCQNF